MPAINVHAVIAGQRTSPVDGLNFNRTFPGDPRGTITQQISAFRRATRSCRAATLFSTSLRRLVARHPAERHHRADGRSGTASTQRRGSARLRRTSRRGDRQSRRSPHRDRCRMPRRAHHGGNRDGRRRHGLPEVLAICRRGVRNVLAHLGVLPASRAGAGPRRCPAARAARHPCLCLRDGRRRSSSHSTPTAREVQAGEVAGRIHCTWDPARAPGRRCATRPTAYSMAAASRAGCARATAAWSWRRPTEARRPMIEVGDIDAARARIADRVRRTPVSASRSAALAAIRRTAA